MLSLPAQYSIMTHILDNPIYNALKTGNKKLSIGEDKVSVFPQGCGAVCRDLKDITESEFCRACGIWCLMMGLTFSLVRTEIAYPPNYGMLLRHLI
jgi:hypothetical protein